MAEGSQNEKAVKAFLAVTGGIEGYFAMGGELLDMAPLLEADEKTLRESGILGIAEEMDRRGSAPHTKETLGEEPLCPHKLPVNGYLATIKSEKKMVYWWLMTAYLIFASLESP